MNQLNSLIVEGNVTRVPEFKDANGHKICVVPLAVNRFYKNAKGEGVSEVSYFDVETFGKLAEVCEKNCEKGRGLRVVGRLKQNRWKNAEGKNVSRVTIIAEHVEFKKLVTKPESEEDLKAMAEANQASLSQEIAMEDEDEEAEKALIDHSCEAGEEMQAEEEPVF